MLRAMLLATILVVVGSPRAKPDRVNIAPLAGAGVVGVAAASAHKSWYRT
jgi:hypothetical protein